jgi:aryl-alcohol dehydrogenase-like predicted oxidoreductase
MKSRGNRNDIVIATKVGMEMGPGARGLSPTYVARAVEDSLRRLQTDRIDLYQSHEDDPDTPFEATLGTYAKLIHDGKVRAIGASNFTAPRLAAAMGASAALGTVASCSLQPHYSLMERQGFESALAGGDPARQSQAISYLKQALQLSPSALVREGLATDGDLDPLRGLPEFQKLIGRKRPRGAPGYFE